MMIFSLLPSTTEWAGAAAPGRGAQDLSLVGCNGVDSAIVVMEIVEMMSDVADRSVVVDIDWEGTTDGVGGSLGTTVLVLRTQ
jgi:hypothetical protein